MKKLIYAVGTCLLMTGLSQAQTLIDDDFSASSISNDQTRIQLDHAGDGSGDDWQSRSDSLWSISGGTLNNPGTTSGRASEGGMGQLYTVTTTDTSLTAIRVEFDYTVGTGSTLHFHATGLTQNGTPAATEALNNLGAQNGNVQNQAEATFADINIVTGADATGASGTGVVLAAGTSGTYVGTFDLSGYSWSADEAPGVTGPLGNVTSLEFLSLMFASNVTDNTGAGAISIDNFKVEAIVAPIAPPTRFNRIDLDGSGNSLVNGSYEDVTQISGTSVTGQVELSNSSFDATDADVYSVAQWSPAADDPNNMVGQYGDAGTLTTNSFYLDTNSIATTTGPSDGVRGILMNSANGYVNKLVNEDILTALALDPILLSPQVQIKVTADVNRRNDNTGGNSTATATFAITSGSTNPDDVANAIAGGTASVVQDSILVGTTTELELNLTGADFDTAAQLNLVVQSVNSAALTLPESTAGQDVTQTSQVVFDNIVFTAFLPGDNDADFDADLADLDQYIGNIGADGTGALLLLDLDEDGIVGANDFMQHYTDLVETSNGGRGTFAGDANLSGNVDVLGDALILVTNLGSASSSWSEGDFNGDGTINVLGDALLLVGNLGRNNGGSTAP